MRKIHNKHIFISSEVGTSGYKMARVLATLPCMYWYSSEENGINPWNISNVTNKNKHHFNRITKKGILPPTHDYVEKYMPNEKQYYKLFDELFTKAGGDDIINEQRVIYCTHSMPSKLLENFPNSLIINIVHDPKLATEKYLDIAINSSSIINYNGIVPDDNEYLSFLKILQKRKEDLTIADVWAFERKKKFYDPIMEEKFRKEIYAKMFSSNIFRKVVDNNRVLNVNENSISYSEIKHWMSSILPK
jgi:hypothetical protein|tara:strand:- start:1292 stop:2032 length:741 start_codon:yes stop_codon:yes gene_type:complete